MLCARSSGGNITFSRRAGRSSRPSTAAAAAAAAASAPPTAAGPATPLPLLPFMNLFRAQVARLEGVQALALPPHLARAVSTEPPVSVQAGACHSDRLRWGSFLRVDTGAAGSGPRRRGRPRRGSAGSSGSALSLLQGQLLPSLFSYQPGLAFHMAAFDGGAAWMVAFEFLTLPPAGPQPGEPAAAGSSGSSGSGGTGGGARSSRAATEEAQRTPEAWQQAQTQRLAAVQLLHAAAAMPDLALQAPAAQQGQPTRCVLSSAQLPEAADNPLLAAAALEAVGLPAFGAALSLHLNGLAAAPADASAAHVRRMAAAQAAYLTREGRRPPLCSAQLQAAFGPGWQHELQDALLVGGMEGLAEVLAPQPGGPAAGAREWMYLDPRVLGSM